MFRCTLCHFLPSKAFQKISLNISFGGVFGCQMTYHNTKKGAAMRKIVSSNLQLPQRVWASAQQSLSKLAFAFALHHSCTLPEPALDTTRGLHLYPRESPTNIIPNKQIKNEWIFVGVRWKNCWSVLQQILQHGEKKASEGVRLLYKDNMFVCLLHGIHLSTDFRKQI